MSPDRRRGDTVFEVGKGNYVHFSSYPFLEINGYHEMAPEDLAFLEAKGCLCLPARDSLNEFVTQYFLHCQFSTPVIDEAMFWKMYLGSQGNVDSRMPLLLFLAMLFASSPYVPLETVQACGFRDGRAAWNNFYQKAKVGPSFDDSKFHIFQLLTRYRSSSILPAAMGL